MSDRLEQLLAFHQRDPKDAFCTYAIAMEHLKHSHADEAIAWLDRTLAIDADYAYAWYQKAKALLVNGRGADAADAVRQGLAAARRKGDSHAAAELQALGDTIGG